MASSVDQEDAKPVKLDRSNEIAEKENRPDETSEAKVRIENEDEIDIDMEDGKFFERLQKYAGKKINNVFKTKQDVRIGSTVPVKDEIDTEGENENLYWKPGVLEGWPRGLMLHFVNKQFKQFDTRTGAEIDAAKILEISKKLGYRNLNPQNVMNLEKKKLEEWLARVQKMDFSPYDSFLFLISTHGGMEVNIRRNGEKDHALYCSDDMFVFTSAIVELFNDENCPTLKGKPKIFIIQACRGTQMDTGVAVNKITETKSMLDNRNEQSSDQSDVKTREDTWVEPEKTTALKCDNDMLVMYAIPPGYSAWRNSLDGSWMIHYLHQEISQSKRTENFLVHLTRVCKLMSEREFTDRKLKAVPIIEHRLQKKLLF